MIETGAIAIVMIILQLLELRRIRRYILFEYNRMEMDSYSRNEENTDKQMRRDMLKKIMQQCKGNTDLINDKNVNNKLDELIQKFRPRRCNSMTAFDKELEQDPRETKSEPSDPKPEWTNGVPQPKAEILDNVYAESKPPDPIANIGKTYTDADTQIMPDEFGKTISRQGVDYLTVDGPDSSAYKRKEKNKKRGRKNQYYTQIDAEDDEEAEHLDELQKEIKVDDH